MGAPTAVGKLTYTVVETEWRDILDASQGPRTPKNRFLLVNVTVVNSADEQKAAPLLQVVDPKGNTYPELTEGEGVTDWLGYLRMLQPGETRSGRLLFDVPQGAYKLRVSSGGDPETEQTALIEMPFQLSPEVPRVSGAQGSSDDVIPPAAPGKK
jgi:hypothetical protein